MDAIDKKFNSLFNEDSIKERPITSSHFNGNEFLEKVNEFTRDEWISILLRSLKLNEDYIDSMYNVPSTPKGSISRLKLHYLTRLLPLVVSNFNFLELGPIGTGKSFICSQLLKYSLVWISGNVTPARLFFNNSTGKVGEIGLRDCVVFDEVSNQPKKNSDVIPILKDYMANGRFSRGQEVMAKASLSFIGSLENQVNSKGFEQFKKSNFILPEFFDTAFYDRIHFWLPGWEMPKMSDKLITEKAAFTYGHLSEIFHFLFESDDMYTKTVKEKMRLSPSIGFRNEWAITKTVSGLIKIIYPNGDLTNDEFNELLAYAIEGRQRIIEQLSLKNPEDFNLSVFGAAIQ